MLPTHGGGPELGGHGNLFYTRDKKSGASADVLDKTTTPARFGVGVEPSRFAGRFTVYELDVLFNGFINVVTTAVNNKRNTLAIDPRCYETILEGNHMIDLLGNLRPRKLGKLFDIIDTDHNGTIAATDYEALGQRLAEVAGATQDASQVAEMKATFKQIWDEFQASADADRDGRVTKEEFTSSVLLPQLTDPGRVVRFIGLTCNLLFGVADTDRNGRISKDEHVRLGTQVFRVSATEAATSFSKLDFWKKGYLTMDAYIVAYTEFLTSPLESAPGNWLFGNF